MALNLFMELHECLLQGCLNPMEAHILLSLDLIHNLQGNIQVVILKRQEVSPLLQVAILLPMAVSQAGLLNHLLTVNLQVVGVEFLLQATLPLHQATPLESPLTPIVQATSQLQATMAPAELITLDLYLPNNLTRDYSRLYHLLFFVSFA